MTSHQAFERNLEHLRRRNRRLADAVEQADPAGIERESVASGGCTLVDRGIRLASAYDPEGEGRRLADRAAEEPADLLVALGLALGHHVEAYRALRRVPVLVYEPSVARLRAVLEVRGELPWIGDPDVHWAGGPDELGAIFATLYASGLAARVLPHPTLARLDPGVAREAAMRLARVKDAADITARTRVVMADRWACMTADNANALLATPSLSRLFDAFPGRAAVVCAAGPSLDRQLPLLARESHRLLVIAIGQALPALRAAGIRPDLVHVLESKDVSHQLAEDGHASDLALVLAPSVHERVFEAQARARFVAYPAPNPFACWLAESHGDRRWLAGGATVAQSAVHVAAVLGADPILLIGQDLAFTGGRVYASGSAYEMVSYREVGEGRFVFTGLAEKKQRLGIAPPTGAPAKDDLLRVPGWDGEPVATSRSYASFIEHYRGIGAWLAERNVRLVNCTEGGARIPGIDQLPFAEAIGELPADALGCQPVIERAFDEAPPVERGTVSRRIKRARRTLHRLEREARSGVRRAERAAGELRRNPAPAAAREVLRAVVRYERRVRRELDALPWIEVLVQGEAQQNELALRRDGADVSPVAAVEMSQRMFASALAAAERGRVVLDRLEARLDDAARPASSETRAGT